MEKIWSSSMLAHSVNFLFEFSISHAKMLLFLGNSIESSSGESDKVRARSRLKDAIADAMNDDQFGECSSESKPQDELEKSDVENIGFYANLPE